ncbi:uncharacterized protein EV420DRAFT_1227860, partial [Desarmillaria tabescens]
ANVILISKFLPWRIHVSTRSVRDMLVALYTALRTKVTKAEMEAVGDRNVMNAFAKWAQGTEEEGRRKGIRRVDFLLENTRFIEIEPTD